MPFSAMRHIVRIRQFLKQLPYRAVKLLFAGDFRALELMYALVFISGAKTKWVIVNDRMSAGLWWFFIASIPFDVVMWFGLSASASWARHKDDNLTWRKVFALGGLIASLWSLYIYVIAYLRGAFQMESAMIQDQVQDILLMLFCEICNLMNIAGIMGRTESQKEARDE